ncbi:hypothetical protein COHA_008722 [Chlorella ohadii]|uniref:Uncharacterized protein n=1 Tax=Chlorella ohadii TaxID=2649997 RepID=A0AAD5DNA5_9CHLO|nr:hypothetical protein COHA_008722 [Chlorella ohadii]
MVFTTAVCPLTLALAPAFYRRHRNKIVLQARLVFAHNTAHPWQEELKWQQGTLSWPALLLTLLYSSRGLVASWGALGWQLPLVLHAIAQGLHVVLACWQVAPAVCQAGGPLHRTPDKLQSLALMLDWPLRAVGGPPILMPPPGACLALVLWFQVSVAFILPTALLLSVHRRSQRQARMGHMALPASGEARQAAGGTAADSTDQAQLRRRDAPLAGPAQMEDEWGIPSVSLFAAQMLWLLLRVTLHETTA